MFEELLAHWEVGELTYAPATNKLAYRIIGARKYQFRKLNHKQRTALLIEAAGVLTNVTDIYEMASALSDETDDASALAVLFPAIIKMLTNERLQPLLERLCATAHVDLGEGKFEALEDEIVAEKVFGEDLGLQIPVAISAALVNFDQLIPLLKKVI